MNVFDLLGYTSSKQYYSTSKTNVYYYALVKSAGPISYSLDGANGSYSIIGEDATFTKTTAYALTASTGSYSIIGEDATFTKTTAYALTASTGSYSIIGEDATFAYNPAVLTNLETLIKLRSFTEHRRF